ncbi:hypothetical protein D3C83_169480 [compost metagenome]
MPTRPVTVRNPPLIRRRKALSSWGRFCTKLYCSTLIWVLGRIVSELPSVKLICA